MWQMTRQDLRDLAVGAAFLGTGGGGDPYIGRLMVQAAMDAGKTVTLLDPSEVPDDALVIPTATTGAPTVLIEKNSQRLRRPSPRCAAWRNSWGARLTPPCRSNAAASIPPCRSWWARSTGLPVVDADGMGRAFPELQIGNLQRAWRARLAHGRDQRVRGQHHHPGARRQVHGMAVARGVLSGWAAPPTSPSTA